MLIDDQRRSLRELLAAKLGSYADRFSDAHLDDLIQKGYTDEEALNVSTRQGLESPPCLPPAYVDKLQKAFNSSLAPSALAVQHQQEYLHSLSAMDGLVDSVKQQEWEAVGEPPGGTELAAVLAVQPGSVVSLDGANFLGDRELGNALWIHPLYPLLLRAILSNMTAGNVVYLLGTAGVGKTVLSALFVTILLLLGFEVIYETYRKSLRVGDTCAYYFKLGEAPQRTFSLTDWANRLEEGGKSLVYVVDGGPATLLQNVTCPIIVFTSTGKDGIKDLRKNQQRRRFWMYAWTLPELEACRNQIAAYAKIEPPLLRAMWEVLGGIPRQVFAPAFFPKYDLESATAEMQQAVEELSEKELRHALSNIVSANTQKNSDRVVHAKRPMGATLDLRTFNADWASPVAQQLVLAQFGQHGFVRACACLWDSSHLKGLPAGLGMLAENIVHNMLASGCTLDGERLEEGSALSGQPTQRQFHFRPAVRHWFNSLSDLQHLCKGKDKEQLCRLYLQPIQWSYPAIDSLSFALDDEEQLVLRLIRITTVKERRQLELTTIQRLLLALQYKPCSVKNNFVVDILLLLKPTAFERKFQGAFKNYQGKTPPEEGNADPTSAGSGKRMKVDKEEEEAAADVLGYDFTGKRIPSVLLELPQYAVKVPILEGPNVGALVKAANEVKKGWRALLAQ